MQYIRENQIGYYVVLIFGWVVVGLISFIDLLTAQKVSLYVFYAVPIFFGAWFAGSTAGIVFCFASVFAWMLVDLRLSRLETSIILWNFALRISFFVGISFVISSLKSTLEREKALAHIDALTELPNRRTFFAIANRERERANRHRHPLTIAYIDLDNFKAINDRSGHDVGDLLLKEVASVLKNTIRKSDTPARIGGDEFVVLFPETDFCSGQAALHKLKENLSKRMHEKEWNIAFSIGAVTCYDSYPDVQEMLINADRLMYVAKASGKNRIEHEQLKAPTTQPYVEYRQTVN